MLSNLFQTLNKEDKNILTQFRYAKDYSWVNIVKSLNTYDSFIKSDNKKSFIKIGSFNSESEWEIIKSKSIIAECIFGSYSSWWKILPKMIKNKYRLESTFKKDIMELLIWLKTWD